MWPHLDPSPTHHYSNMSDLGRKDISDKIESAVKPNSEKSTPEHFSDKVTDKLDNAIGDNTSNKDKSFVQQASDAIFGDKK